MSTDPSMPMGMAAAGMPPLPVLPQPTPGAAPPPADNAPPAAAPPARSIMDSVQTRRQPDGGFVMFLALPDGSEQVLGTVPPPKIPPAFQAPGQAQG